MTQEPETIGLEELRYRLSDVLAVAELATRILTVASTETEINEAEGGCYDQGVEDGRVLFARELIDLMNKQLQAESEA